jgi:hypothetical protein
MTLCVKIGGLLDMGVSTLSLSDVWLGDTSLCIQLSTRLGGECDSLKGKTSYDIIIANFTLICKHNVI